MIEQQREEGGTWSRNGDPASSRRSLSLEEPPFITGTPGNTKDGGVTTDWPAMCCCHDYHPWGQWKQMTGTIIWGVITKVSCLYSSPPHPPVWANPPNIAIFPACRKKFGGIFSQDFITDSHWENPALTFIFIPPCCITSKVCHPYIMTCKVCF